MGTWWRSGVLLAAGLMLTGLSATQAGTRSAQSTGSTGSVTSTGQSSSTVDQGLIQVIQQLSALLMQASQQGTDLGSLEQALLQLVQALVQQSQSSSSGSGSSNQAGSCTGQQGSSSSTAGQTSSCTGQGSSGTSSSGSGSTTLQGSSGSGTTTPAVSTSSTQARRRGRGLSSGTGLALSTSDPTGNLVGSNRLSPPSRIRRSSQQGSSSGQGTVAQVGALAGSRGQSAADRLLVRARAIQGSTSSQPSASSRVVRATSSRQTLGQAGLVRQSTQVVRTSTRSASPRAVQAGGARAFTFSGFHSAGVNSVSHSAAVHVARRR